MIPALVSIALVAGGFGASAFVLRLLQRVATNAGTRDRILLFLPMTWLLLLPLWIFVGVLALPLVWGVFFGLGTTLLAWAVLTLGAIWGFTVNQAAQRRLTSLLEEREDVSERFRASRLFRWLLPRK